MNTKDSLIDDGKRPKSEIKSLFSLPSKISIIFFIVLICASLYIASFTETGARTYWPYILSSYFLALFAYFLFDQGKIHNNKNKPFEFLFSPKIWLHRSSFIDYTIIIVNYFLFAYVIYYVTIDTNFIYTAIEHLFNYFDIEQSKTIPSVFIFALFTFILFLSTDLAHFIVHMCEHRFPFLWEFHKVHHSAEVMTPLTFYRSHPFEIWLEHSILGTVYALVSASFLYFYPNAETFSIVIAINTVIFFLNATLANLRHSHIWISYGPFIEKFILSPAQHQIHHSTQIKHYDKNFGSTFAFWDWLFNSLYVTTKHEEVVFGLGEDKETAKLNTIWDYYWTPFVHFFKIIFKKFKK